MWRSKTPDAKPSSPAEFQPAAAAPPPVAQPLPPPPAVPEARMEATRISASIRLKGEITGREDFYLDGEMEGSIRMPDARVTVGPNGRVTASIEASEITVEGRVTGDLCARVRIELRRTAFVEGHLSAERLAIQEGARVRGTVETARGSVARPVGSSVAAVVGSFS